MKSRLGLAALVVSMVANIPVLAATAIAAVLFAILGDRVSVFANVGNTLVNLGPVPFVFASLSLVALALGIAANLRQPGQRDGVTAIGIVIGTPILCFLTLAVVALV